MYSEALSKEIANIDEKHSRRFIALDPKGYFIIKLDQDTKEIIVEHYKNDIDKLGRAIDPDTGKPIKCEKGEKRCPNKVYKGQTAKELGIKLSEVEKETILISRLDHALYLGRELQKAEYCLIHGIAYVQD